MELEISQSNERPTVIVEQSAHVLNEVNVFCNPVQEFNRDMSVAVLNVFVKKLWEKTQACATNDSDKNFVRGVKCENGIRILEALSATGLRGIRYAKEVPNIKEIIANDISKSAVASITKNVFYNKVEHLVNPTHSDAMTLMYLAATKPEEKFDVIDLDPYGCPTQFLDGAIQSINNGGLLLVTATDMAVLAGSSPDTCFVKYSGSISLRNKACHEMALRILLRSIETHANRYGKYIHPLLSISADFYIRVFVRVFTGQLQCKQSICKQAMIYQCTGCETFTLQPLGIRKPNPNEQNALATKFALPTGPSINKNCEHCSHKHHLGGPIWSAPIHHKRFVEDLLEMIATEPLSNLGTHKRLTGMLSVICEELPDIPLYYSVDKMCCVLKMEIVPMLKFRSALLHAGYQVSYSHAYKNSIKTNAPPAVLWDILRCWNKIHPVKEKRLVEGSPTANILSKEPEVDYNLNDIHPLANPESRKKALARFPENPTSHWGPGTRATVMIGQNKMQKSYKNQNKRRKMNEDVMDCSIKDNEN
ncbi:tRNA (guanine(26)-N(2))-dimethyltransferase [Condylostylus longicornis]|uniref:tRNA (guanine(26)-N(2))-dimethyltransferase n=1 Tax=Condylostylus longicornis TaxID=2530218 RepID=UPI00244E121A|nr:tRNA (guanine(26)-N(2))-dimethyltransferase [Condylostylus longicornis]